MLQTIPQVWISVASHVATISHSVCKTIAGIIAAQANTANRSHDSLQIDRTAEFRDQRYCYESENC